MKLQKQKSRTYNTKNYHKYWIVIPNKIIEKTGWKTGQELKAEIKEEQLTITKK